MNDLVKIEKLKKVYQTGEITFEARSQLPVAFVDATAGKDPFVGKKDLVCVPSTHQQLRLCS